MPDLRLTLTMLAVLLLMQGVCWLLARGLGMRPGKAVLLGGLLLPLAFLAPWLSGSRLLVPNDILRRPTLPDAPWVAAPDAAHDLLNDAVYQFLPWELEVRHALSGRRLPFWSDLLEGGSSPWSNPQAAVLSPIAMAARPFPIQHFLLGALALKILVAFDGAWLLARRVGRSRAASLLAAAGFALGGGVMAWSLFPHTAAVAWVPWLAAGTIGVVRRPRPRIVATTAVLTAALLLSGHPEVAAVGGLLAVVCGLSFRRRRAGARGFMRGVGAAALAAVLGVALSAPHLLPFLEVMSDSQRAHETLAHEMPPHRFSPLHPATWFLGGAGGISLAPASPHTFGRPYRGPYEGPLNWAETVCGYTGLLGLAGAVIALLAVRDRRSWPFLGFALLGLLLAAQFLPLAWLTQAVPPLRVPAYPRFLLVTSLALCIGGAFGTDALLRRRGRIGTAAAFLVAAGISLAVRTDPWTLTLWALLAGAAALALWRPVPRTGAALALGAVLLLDLVPWSRHLLPRGHTDLFYPRTPFLDMAIREVKAEGGPWRLTSSEKLFYPSLMAVYGVEEPRVHNPLAPMDYVRVLDAAFGFHPTKQQYFAPSAPSHPLLHFLNVRVLITTEYKPPVSPVAAAMERLDGDRFRPFRVHRNRAALPRWFLPRSAEPVSREEIGLWIATMADPAQVALWEDEARDWMPPVRQEPVPVRMVSAVPGRVVLDVPEPGGERLLATSIRNEDGWRARAGGRDLPILTVNGAFLGVRVPAEVREVELRFLPYGFVTGAILAGLAGLVVLGLWVGPRRAT
ncbi:MAG TPA: YfhO family protein [Thermoanaerobaculia bacterium]|nr:YfhO family protein [Thermoanaerobaculia bacterium]